jgi:pyruvate carboxylase subunit B
VKATLRLAAAALDVEMTRRPDGTYLCVVEGDTFDVGITKKGDKRIARIAGTYIEIELRDGHLFVEGADTPWSVLSVERNDANGHGGHHGPARIRPPMAGKLESLRVKTGQAVEKGDVLFVLEAMKMQNDVRSPVTGVVSGVHAAPGEAVGTNRVIVDIDAR